MTPNDIAPLDDALLAELLTADAALAEGRDPELCRLSETLNTLKADTVSDYISVLRRLGHRGTPAPPERTVTGPATAPLRLGRFEIVNTLGQGGFGIVYLARDPTLGREVALKVPRPEVLITPDVRRRFLREARAAGGLDHPNIVAVYEVGEAGPVCYIASAYCEGPTLSAWLKGRTEPVPSRLAAQVVVALGGAVQHAHERGVLHRDIKPSNVILAEGRLPGSEGSRESRVARLTDFGLARIAEETGDETRTGVPIGSPPYMAPEQAAGRSRDVGPTTDVYALGATLYETLTGRPPFRGETATETLRLVLEAEPVAPRTLRPGLPRDLETICLKCLEKDPARRYATARALGEDLDRFLDHQPIHARPISLRQRVGKWVRRRPGHSSAIFLVLMLGSALVGEIAYRDILLQKHANDLEREVARADANARLAQRHLEAFQLRQASEALNVHQVERSQDILRTIEAARESSGEVRKPGDLGFAWHYLMSQACRNLVVLSDRRSERVNLACLSPDGLTLATGDEDGTIRLRDPGTGRVSLTLKGHELPIHILAFSPDGRRLASAATTYDSSGRRIEAMLWDLDSPRVLARIPIPPDRFVETLQFDVDGRTLWETSWTARPEGGRLARWDVATDPVHPRLEWSKESNSIGFAMTPKGAIFALEKPGKRFVVHEAWAEQSVGRIGPVDHDFDRSVLSPDGKLLAVGRGAARTTTLWEVQSGQVKARFGDQRPHLYSVIFSPDSRYLAFCFGYGEVELRDLRSGAIGTIPPSDKDPSFTCDIAFSSDSRFLVTTVGDLKPITVWQLAPWKQVARYPGIPAGFRSLSFAPDSRSLILAVEPSAVRWEFLPHPEPIQPAGHADEAWSLAFSPDGSVLASGSDDTDEPRTIKLWDAATGTSIRGWNAGVGTVSALAFAPAGRVLASGHLGADPKVRLWDAGTGQLLTTLSGHTDSVRTLAFSPDGTTLATAGSDRTVRLWDVSERRWRHILTGHDDTVRHLSFSPDGTRLATAANDRAIRIWDVGSGRLASSLPWVEKVTAVLFSPDGRSLVSADEDGLITVWDLATASHVQTMATEESEVRCMAFSPDGEALATAGKSRKVRLWNPDTGQELLTLEGHKAQINGVAFSPDGSVLASCSHDGAVRLWCAGAVEPWAKP